jgi:AraC-like DNA-binding protein
MQPQADFRKCSALAEAVAPEAGVSYGRARAGQSLSVRDATRLEDRVRLRELASERGLPISSLVRAFRGSFKASPHQWLMQRRIEKAQHLLRCGDMPLSEIAIACGFVDQSHFTRVFRQSRHEPWRWKDAAVI